MYVCMYVFLYVDARVHKGNAPLCKQYIYIYICIYSSYHTELRHVKQMLLGPVFEEFEARLRQQENECLSHYDSPVSEQTHPTLSLELPQTHPTLSLGLNSKCHASVQG
jgi:hypothetical protein